MREFLLPVLAFVGDSVNCWSLCCLALTTSMKISGAGSNPTLPAVPDLSSKPPRTAKAINTSRRIAVNPKGPARVVREPLDKKVLPQKLVQPSSSSVPSQTSGAPVPPGEKISRSTANGQTKSKRSNLVRQTVKDPLVWIDLEMTGLDIEKDTIIEIACIITDGILDKQIEGPTIAIKHSDKVLNSMTDWCIKQHRKSGLTDRCKESRITLAQAELEVLSFLQEHIRPNTAQMAGNSIHVDKAFIQKHMPKINAYLHFRIVDVSTLNEISKRWFPKDLKNLPKKDKLHTAMSDIKDSIQELKYYRHSIFRKTD